MTAPVTQDDIVSGVVKYLSGKPDVLAALGTFTIGSSLVPGLFQYRLWTEMEGSQSTACVIDHDGGWVGANTYNTMQFPRLTVSIWADPLRDQGNNMILPGEVQKRANAAWQVIDKYLHNVGGGSRFWGTLRVVDSIRLVEPVMYQVPDGDGLVRLQSYYAISQG